MIQGLYAAATGMMAIEDRTAVIANNIANAMTPGFKRQVAVQRGFYAQFAAQMQDTRRFDLSRAPGGGLKIVQTFSDLRNGILTSTGNTLDIALLGPGYIAVETPAGVRFTRNGRLSVGEGGQLITSEGNPVVEMGGGSINVSGGTVHINSRGGVMVAGQEVGQIRIVEFENPKLLQRDGSSLYRVAPNVDNPQSDATQTTVESEKIEMSNVQIPSEIAQLMLALRAYAANQRAITAIDETANRLISSLGSPA